MMKQSLQRIPVISILMILFSVSCTKKPETLAEAYKDYFEIGAAVTAGDFQSLVFYKTYDEELLNNFNLFVAENGMKPEAVYSWAGPDSYNYKYGDLISDYASAHGAKMRGHCLVWHDQSPKALMKTEEGKEAARASMKEYISAYVGHFKGRIHYWDVVNEAISDDPSEIYRTASGWYQAYGGPEFILDAFTFAREADPEAGLYYVDYNICDPQKRQKVITMIKELGLIEKGLIDGIGIQAHWNLYWPSTDWIDETVKTFGEMGLDVQFTEFDIDCYNGDTQEPEMEYTPELETELTARYDEIFACFRSNSEYISSVTLWGVADDHTWLHKISGGKPLPRARTNFPLLFDMRKQPKKAYYAVKDFKVAKKK